MRTYLLSFLVFLSFSLFAQSISSPPSGDNQKSVVTQYMGSLAYVSITYNSPDVTSPRGEDRRGHIWGELVPYGLNDLGFGSSKAAPWRAGANENTVIEFSHDVEIEGKKLAAGVYGLHIIVEETAPWTLIFSHNSTAWGSYFYKESDDALRVQISPQDNEYREWLTYEFIDRRADQCTVAMMWENKQLPFTIKVPNMEEVYLTKIRQELENSPGFTWQAWNQAAAYCLQNNINLEEALSWAEQSINAPFSGQANFTTISTKAQILQQLNKTEAAEMAFNEAIAHPTANAFQVHGLGRSLIGQGHKEMAMKVLEANHKKHKGAWPTEVGMARACSALGQYKEAIKHVEVAITQAPDDQNKKYLEGIISSLQAGKDMN